MPHDAGQDDAQRAAREWNAPPLPQDATRVAEDRSRDAAQGARIAARDAAQSARIAGAWRRLSPLPGGRWLFSRLVGRFAPYSGSIGARVLELEPGRAVLELRDRRRVRNHLRSVHAIALANLGELASGLATVLAMPPGVRGIPVAIAIEYFHKARGTLRAEGLADLPDVDGPTNAQVTADIRDAGGELVAQVRVRWTLERV